jgi:hypothetical protein
LVNETTKKARGISYCETNPTENVCACINMSKGVRHCLANPTHPGCDTLVAEYNKFPGNAQTEFDTKNFSPKCFAPDICTQSGQYQPMSPADPCNQTIAVCQQDLNLYGDIANQAMINISQSMDCTASSDNTPSAGAGSGPSTAPSTGPSTGPDDETIEEEFIVPKNIHDLKTFIPRSLDGIKTSRRQQTGTGAIVGVVFISCMCLVLIMMMGGGGNGNVKPRQRFR